MRLPFLLKFVFLVYSKVFLGHKDFIPSEPNEHVRVPPCLSA